MVCLLCLFVCSLECTRSFTNAHYNTPAALSTPAGLSTISIGGLTNASRERRNVYRNSPGFLMPKSRLLKLLRLAVEFLFTRPSERVFKKKKT